MTGRPALAGDYELLADVARQLVRVETEEMRQLVEGGHRDREAARAHVRALRAVAIGWRAIDAGEPEPPHLYDALDGGAWVFERIAALTEALARATTRAAADPANEARATGLEAISTLIWWERATPSARWLVDFNPEARRRLAADRAAERAADAAEHERLAACPPAPAARRSPWPSSPPSSPPRS